MAEYTVTYTWEGTLEVEAENEEEARQAAIREVDNCGGIPMRVFSCTEDGFEAREN